VTNVLTNDAADPITKTPEYKACSLRIEKMPQEAEAGERAEVQAGSA
jgi:predicted molibdopterin-dependent oxidoreductase YjgC